MCLHHLAPLARYSFTAKNSSDKGNVGKISKVSNFGAIGDGSDKDNVGKINKIGRVSYFGAVGNTSDKGVKLVKLVILVP